MMYRYLLLSLLFFHGALAYKATVTLSRNGVDKNFKTEYPQSFPFNQHVVRMGDTIKLSISNVDYRRVLFSHSSSIFDVSFPMSCDSECVATVTVVDNFKSVSGRYSMLAVGTNTEWNLGTIDLQFPSADNPNSLPQFLEYFTPGPEKIFNKKMQEQNVAMKIATQWKEKYLSYVVCALMCFVFLCLLMTWGQVGANVFYVFKLNILRTSLFHISYGLIFLSLASFLMKWTIVLTLKYLLFFTPICLWSGYYTLSQRMEARSKQQ